MCVSYILGQCVCLCLNLYIQIDDRGLFYVTDRDSGTRFLVDTGAAVSVIPANTADKRHLLPLVLQAANKTHICTYAHMGSVCSQCVLGCSVRFSGYSYWLMFRSLSSAQILLRHYGLLVDLRTSRLWDATTSLSVNGIILTHIVYSFDGL